MKMPIINKGRRDDLCRYLNTLSYTSLIGFAAGATGHTSMNTLELVGLFAIFVSCFYFAFFLRGDEK
jgi:hypothetical protein